MYIGQNEKNFRTDCSIESIIIILRRSSLEKPADHYWMLRIEKVKEALEKNNFEVYTVDNLSEAQKTVMDIIIPACGPKRISWGGSMTVVAAGLYHTLKSSQAYDTIDTFDQSLSDEEKIERRRQSLLTDLFITGTNAITGDGCLVNLDMIGNRVAALTFGPKIVVVIVGRNKIVAGLEDAMHRIKDYAAPTNAMRLNMKTPCTETSYCLDCKSPKRICNTWTITEKSFPKGRVKIVLINEDAGL
jgi:L-lactate utilization protein LutB